VADSQCRWAHQGVGLLLGMVERPRQGGQLAHCHKTFVGFAIEHSGVSFSRALSRLRIITLKEFKRHSFHTRGKNYETLM
jgi:hypothetical protein